MANKKLWDLVNELKGEEYEWVDLTHVLSPETPHWYGFNPLKQELIFDNAPDADEAVAAPMRVYQYTVVGQYGTHVDAPSHFHYGTRDIDGFGVKELVYPLVVVDKHKECEENPEYTMTVEDLQKWEEEYGQIPDGAFVAFRSDFYKKDDLDNKDADGNPHCPGWSVEALKWLVEERNVGAIGHEPADTDPSYATADPNVFSFPAEEYILEVDKFQIEVMKNLDKVPPVGAMIICGFPRLKDGVGFPARCFAIFPK